MPADNSATLLQFYAGGGEYLIIESEFRFTVKSVSRSLGKTNVLLAVNNVVNKIH